jgi:hypothetical protein
VNSLRKASFPGYKTVSEKSGSELEEWIVPAFGIPIRNPAVANKSGGEKSWPGSPAVGQNWREGVGLMEFVCFPQRDAGE